MTDQELERRLANAVSRTAPDDLEAVLSRCGEQNGSVKEMKPQNVIEMNTNKKAPRKRIGAWLAAACAALVLLGAGGAAYYYQSCAVASVVSLDVNPSIELNVNRGERVISCRALNEDAAAVLFQMGGGADLEGVKLDVAVNAIVGALVREGYLDSISSAILISVEDRDQARAARIQQELVASVDGVLQLQAPGTAILSQVLTQDAFPGDTALDTGISAGKAAMVRQVMAAIGTDSAADFDKLAALSVEELDDLLETGARQIPIGKPAAAMAAETYAGTLGLNSAATDVDPELDEFPAHYEVELKTAWGKFEYIVDAWTGEVLRGQKDVLSLAPASGASAQIPSAAPEASEPNPPAPAATQPPAAAPGTQDIGQEAAKQAALSHAGVSEDQVTGLKVKQDWDDGRLEYEVEFWCGGAEYDYTIDGLSGSVLKHELEHHTGQHSGSGGGTDTAPDIGQEAAKTAALSHAGVSEDQASKLKVERDWDDGRLEYEVEFKVGRTEYEYTIDGATGAVLEYEQDRD